MARNTLEVVMGICFACGSEIKSDRIPCPNCGYMFDACSDMECPNKIGNTCIITENICDFIGEDFGYCKTKNEAEAQGDFF